MHRILTPAKKHWKKVALVVVALVGIILGTSACTSDGHHGQATETKTQQTNYDRLVAQQPAHTMPYSPTRDTINFWIDTWGKHPNKLAYVYFQNDKGELTGYYVFKGLPVSYCTSLTPNYQLRDEGDAGELSVPAPSVDGVYYSGGECNTYYGRDATTGAYVEYTAGMGINVLLYDQPLTGHPNVPNLSPGAK